jgi:hypothetical protein
MKIEEVLEKVENVLLRIFLFHSPVLRPVKRLAGLPLFGGLEKCRVLAQENVRR